MKPGTALLWVVGSEDRHFSVWGSRDYAFDKAPPQPLNAFVVVEGADHFDVLNLAKDRITDWVKKLAPPSR